jgi:hypothetical protein
VPERGSPCERPQPVPAANSHSDPSVRWLATKQATKRPSTADLYATELRSHVLPAFAGMPQPAVHSALPRVAAALRPGGWLVLGYGKVGGTPVQDALTRLKTLAYGGTPLDEAAACHLLRNAGLTSVRTMPTPPGAPAITIGQKPA